MGKFSGVLHFFEFDFISLSPPCGIIEVLSMGAYNPNTNKSSTKEDDGVDNVGVMDSNNMYPVEGAYHCVIDNEIAYLININNSKSYLRSFIYIPIV